MPDTSDAPLSLPARVLLLGGSGLVGQQALRQLLADPAVGEVRALVRRDLTVAQLLGMDGPAQVGINKLRVLVANFDRLEAHADWFDVDWVFCALGTTIKQAGSQAAFRQVDFAYPVQIAQLAKAQGAQRFMLVSALGANAKSRVFYSRVKGELEEAIKAMGFAHVSVAQPSILEGERGKFRLGERIALKLGFLMPERYKPVRAWRVARALIMSAKAPRSAWQTLDNTTLRRIG